MPTPCRRRDLWVLGLSCVLLRLPALLSSRWYDPDEAAIAVQARTIVAGGRLYVDMADRKPPIPPFIYAAWFDLTNSNDPRGPRLIAALLLALAVVALTAEVARTHGRRVALWTAALYVGGSLALAPADSGAANYAHFALPLATVAILACRRGRNWPLLGGVLLGVAILSRQSWIFAIPAGAVSCWMSARYRGIALYLIGACAAVSTAALMAPWSDYWFWNFKSSPGFVFAAIGIGTAFGRGTMSLLLFVLRHLAMVGGALAGFANTLRRQLDLWLWTLTGLGSIAAGFRFYGHYWLQIVPPLALLAGPTIAAWTAKWRLLAGWSLAATAAFSFVSMCVPQWFRDRRDAAPVAALIDSCTAPTDRVFVWGSFPELLVAVDRPTAGTLVHSDFVTGRSGGRQAATDSVTPGAQERMMADLRAHPPAALIDTSGVPGLGYGTFPMSSNPLLSDFASRSYVATRFEGYVVGWLQGAECAGGHATGG